MKPKAKPKANSAPSRGSRKAFFRYPTGISFRCERCSICCRDAPGRPRLILALRSEVWRISEKTGLRPEDFSEESLDTPPYEYALKKRADGSCVFLEEKSCSIYELRPLVCRFYPFSLRKVANGYVFTFTEECPGLGIGRPLPRAFFRELLAYALEELNLECQPRKPRFLCQMDVVLRH